MNPFAARVTSLLPNQVHKKAIEVDSHLRVKGAPTGTVYALGDCATVSFNDRPRSWVFTCFCFLDRDFAFGSLHGPC
jgi:NADH dehydrogenase FAD-containing subunit